MEDRLPEWESELIHDAVEVVDAKLEAERARAQRRALQLAREQAYHRLAVAIDRPSPRPRGSAQLSLFPTEPTLFDEDPVGESD